ncbi:DUF748 domain-containing protein [Marinicella litoralis]|uniref:Uncharacterized protein DUF748 n=1 Tax=Marinicella litoralis TaxID=644220 RepID=A0A4R6XRR3_9GAMM|nr:DUF748 domain-containing protein [Marinicella litoralis]TDR22595.1 uncharacterized protein DUF748 [Marinicella litoralis]
MIKRLYKYTSFWLLLMLLLYLLFGFFYAPKLIEKHLNVQIQQHLEMQAEWSSLKFNPITFTLELSDLQLTDRKHQTWYSSQKTAINFDPFNLLWGQWQFSNLILKQPNITLSTDESGQVIIPALPEFSVASDPEESIDLIINNIELNQGLMNLQAGNIKKDFELNIQNISIKQNKFSLTDENSYFDLTMTTENGESVTLNGHYNHAQQHLQSKINLNNWQASTLNQALPNELMVNNQSGLIQAEGRIDWPLQHKPLLNFNHIQIDNLGSLWHNSIQLIGLSANMEQLEINTETKEIKMDRFHSGQASWQLNWPLALPDASNTPSSTENQSTVKPWSVSIKQIDITNWPIELIDREVAATLPINIESLAITSFNTQSEPVLLHSIIQVTQHGTITINSELGLSPLYTEGKLNLEMIHLPDLASWITAQSGMVITKGSLSGQQNFKYHPDNFEINGHVTVIDGFIQNQAGQEVVDFGQLMIGETSINSTNHTIIFDQITLDHANGRIIEDNHKAIDPQSLGSSEAINQDNTIADHWTIKIGTIKSLNTPNNADN